MMIAVLKLFPQSVLASPWRGHGHEVLPRPGAVGIGLQEIHQPLDEGITARYVACIVHRAVTDINAAGRLKAGRKVGWEPIDERRRGEPGLLACFLLQRRADLRQHIVIHVGVGVVLP